MSPLRHLSVALFTMAILVAKPSRAESDRGPFFVEGQVLGLALALGDVVGAAYLIEVDFGYHVMGTHEGLVVGAAQRFDVAITPGASTGATLARVGWDFAVPIGQRELTLAPYLQGGVAYPFEAGDVAGVFGTGFNLRIFPVEHVEAKPGEATPKRVKTKRVTVAADRIEIGEKIQFKVNEAVIEEVSFGLLEEIASVIKQSPQIKKLRIEGHASSEGDAERNRKLSDERAKAVRAHLIQKGGVGEDLLVAEGFGSDKPLADNETDPGREKNRRVEFNILEQDETTTKVETTVIEGPSAAEGFFIVVKGIELNLAIAGDVVVPILTSQAGVGYAF